MKLSHRLETIASFVPKGSIVADIGTDHGYIPIWLLQQKIAVKAIAIDVGEGPLKRAREHIVLYGLEDLIETRLSNGLSGLYPKEADTVVIAGMGGELIIKILTEGKHMWPSVKRWILSPQSEIHKVRRFLRTHGFCEEEEAFLFDEGKYYTVIAAGPWKGEEAVAENTETKTVYDLYGEILIKQKNPVLLEYLEKEKVKKLSILEKMKDSTGSSRIFSLKEEIKQIQEAEYEMQ